MGAEAYEERFLIVDRGLPTKPDVAVFLDPPFHLDLTVHVCDRSKMSREKKENGSSQIKVWKMTEKWVLFSSPFLGHHFAQKTMYTDGWCTLPVLWARVLNVERSGGPGKNRKMEKKENKKIYKFHGNGEMGVDTKG